MKKTTALATRWSTALVAGVCILLLIALIEVAAAFNTAFAPSLPPLFASSRRILHSTAAAGSAESSALFDSLPDDYRSNDGDIGVAFFDNEGNSKRPGSNNDSTMNAFQTKLYQDLMQFAAEGKKHGVRAKDFPALIPSKNSSVDNIIADNNKEDVESEYYYYRIFTYTFFPKRLAMNPFGRSCRGTMFLMNKTDDTPVRLASLPMEKFFNLNERESTIDLDLSTIEYATLKADGSLISTYVDDTNHRLCLKSLTAIDSPHSDAATEYLEKEQPKLKTALACLARMGYTIDMEFCSPLHSVVIEYPVTTLHILSIRSHETGAYLSREDVLSKSSDNDLLKEIGNEAQWIPRVTVPQNQTADEFWPIFVPSVATMKGIEGYVLTMAKTGQRVKIKTDWYLPLHSEIFGGGKTTTTKKKDLTPLQLDLFEAACDKTTDDLRAKYHEYETVLNDIEAMEELVEELYDDLSVSIENLYQELQHLSSIKEYIDTCKHRLEKDDKDNAEGKLLCAIKRYVHGRDNGEGDEFDYLAWMKRYYRELRIMDHVAGR